MAPSSASILFLTLGCALSVGLLVVGQDEPQDHAQDNREADYELVLVQAMWRHGNRSQTVPYPWSVEEYLRLWPPFESGDLTPNGRRESLKMGQFLRKRYGNFLPPYFSYTAAHITCMDLTRTRETSWVGMNAVWPPAGPQVWQDQGLGQIWTPIPCEYKPLLEDELLEPWLTCPRIIELTLATLKSPEFKAEVDKITKFGLINKYVALNVGRPSVDDFGLVLTYDALACMEGSGIELPPWAKHVYPNPLIEVYGMNLNLFTRTTESLKISVGNFWNMTINLANSLQKGDLRPLDRVFFGYSFHDQNLVLLLKSLQLVSQDDLPVPVFCAALLFEWYRDRSNSSQIGVKFVYRNNPSGDAVTLKMPGCGEICPLDTLKAAVADLIPVQPRSVYCNPVRPLVLEDFEEYLQLMKLWYPPEFIPKYRQYAENYLKEQKINSR